MVFFRSSLTDTSSDESRLGHAFNERAVPGGNQGKLAVILPCCLVPLDKKIACQMLVLTLSIMNLKYFII